MLCRHGRLVSGCNERVTVAWSGGDITYTPALNFTGTDRFTYTIGDGRGGTATAQVQVTVASALISAPNKLAIQSMTDGCMVVFEGAAGQTYVLERSLDFLFWTPIFTNAPADGILHYSETNCPASGAFYRVFMP